MGMFSRGYDDVREEKERQDEAKEKAGKRLWRMFLAKDGDEAPIRFLTEEPINFHEHTVKVTRGGKERYENVVCNPDGCELCASGDKPSFKGAFLIWDEREYEYKDRDGKKKTGKGQLRLYVAGTRVLSQLDRLSDRYGLTSRDYTIVRTGSGTSTTYTIERGDDVRKLSEKEIENMLPEKLRESYNGTMDSLYDIVVEQLQMSLNSSDSKSDSTKDDDSDDDEEDTSSALVGCDDDEETEKPTGNKNSLKKPTLFKGGKKPKDNSVKKLFSSKK
jgi:hypothetical protein